MLARRSRAASTEGGVGKSGPAARYLLRYGHAEKPTPFSSRVDLTVRRRGMAGENRTDVPRIRITAAECPQSRARGLRKAPGARTRTAG